jgi:tRNA1Val (adenine37-N6)-methyltransferase
MFTEDALFDGRLLLRQSRDGYRFSADAPLLIWFSCTRTVSRSRCAVDLGAGCGVVALGLLAAERAERVVAVEAQDRLSALCESNAELNGFRSRLEIVSGDMRGDSRLEGRLFDLIAINPPYWRANQGCLPEDPERRVACHEILVDLDGWVAVAARLLEPRRERLCAVFPARRVIDLLSSLSRNDLGATTVLAVHPRPDENAALVLVEARRGNGRPVALAPPLFLRDKDNAETKEARSIFSGEFSERLKALTDTRPRTSAIS